MITSIDLSRSTRIVAVQFCVLYFLYSLIWLTQRNFSFLLILFFLFFFWEDKNLSLNSPFQIFFSLSPTSPVIFSCHPFFSLISFLPPTTSVFFFSKLLHLHSATCALPLLPTPLPLPPLHHPPASLSPTPSTIPTCPLSPTTFQPLPWPLPPLASCPLASTSFSPLPWPLPRPLPPLASSSLASTSFLGLYLPLHLLHWPLPPGWGRFEESPVRIWSSGGNHKAAVGRNHKHACKLNNLLFSCHTFGGHLPDNHN